MGVIRGLPFPVSDVHTSPELPVGTIVVDDGDYDYVYRKVDALSATTAVGDVMSLMATDDDVTEDHSTGTGIYGGVAINVVAADEYSLFAYTGDNITAAVTTSMAAGVSLNVDTGTADTTFEAKAAATETAVGQAKAAESGGTTTVIIFGRR